MTFDREKFIRGSKKHCLCIHALFTKRKSASLSTLLVSDAKTPAALNKATGVWILGDDGPALARVTGGTAVEAALRAVIARGGVVGGNGSVARALTKVMITTGDPHATVSTGLDLELAKIVSLQG